MKKIAFCGGHLTPALAVIEELEKYKHIKVIFFGRKFAMEGSRSFSAEYRIISQKNIEFVAITTGRLQRRFTRYTLLSLIKIPLGLAQSFFYLLRTKPDLVVSFGGYLSVPVIFGAWLLGINSIIHEQSSIAGLATKINSVFAKKVFLSWPSSQKYFDQTKTVVIGNALRKSLFSNASESRSVQKFLIKPGKLIYVTGGNQGSHVLNQLTFELISSLAGFNILHQVGTANYRNDYTQAKKIKRKNYLAVDYLQGADVGAILRRADLVVARSGANTIWELAVFKKVAILIPLPVSAQNEQIANAKILSDAGSAVIIKEEDLSPKKIKESISLVLKNYDLMEKSAIHLERTLPKGADAKIANFILSE